jgi:hydroxymethylbilane synthase
MRIGTRRSALALAQARLVAGLLGDAELVPMASAGDRGEGTGDKSRWVSDLELALQDGRIDLAVHSAKDVPGEPAEGLELLGCPPRAAAEDVLCGAQSIDALGTGARVGTSSLRRIAQLRSARPDLDVVSVRGNVDTRMAKLAAGEDGLQAIVLARAGLDRLERAAEAGGTLDPSTFVPAPGQGALALQGRAGDEAVGAAVAGIEDRASTAALLAERSLARELGADCDTPLGAHAVAFAGDGLRLRAWVGLPDGSSWILDELEGALDAPQELGLALAQRMSSVGAQELLAAARGIAS